MRISTGVILIAALLGASVLRAADDGVLVATSGVSIRAQRSTIDFRTGERSYTGNVIVDHLNFHLWADEVQELREKGAVASVTAVGSPEKVRQDPPYTKDISHGVARRMSYTAATRELKLWDYTVTDPEGNTMTGKVVTYLLK
jgi:lipopolysaccharide transport protein LptA